MPASPAPADPPTAARQEKNGSPAWTKTAMDKQAAMKGGQFAKAIGIDKPANVRDKIKRWQDDLGPEASSAEDAVAPTRDDDAVEITAPSPKLPPTPKAAAPKEKPIVKPTTTTPNKATEALPERPKTKSKPVHNVLDEEVLVATAPKKRVISDSHWRNKTSPPKNGGTRSSPKPLPTAWVRPAVRKTEPVEPKPSTPDKPDQKPITLFTSKSTGQKQRDARNRRKSRPNSSGNEERPTSSGSGSGNAGKSGNEALASSSSPTDATEKHDLVRMRRRRRSGTSPRGSLSAEETTPTQKNPARKSRTSDDQNLSNQITVEYEESRVTSPRDDDIRERRKRSRRVDYDYRSPDESAREAVSTGRRRSHPKSIQRDVEEERPSKSPEGPAAPKTPPQVFGNRLQAWLSTTPDPFVDRDGRKRRTSKETVSTLDLPSKQDASDMSASSDVKDTPAEEEPERKSSSRRRRRRRSPTLKIDTQDTDEKTSTVTSDPSEPTNTVTDKETTPTLSLKRRGARRTQHSPTKERTVSAPPHESKAQDDDAASSTLSSSVDASTLDFDAIPLMPRPNSVAQRRFFPSTGKRLSTIASVETFGTKTHLAPVLEAVSSEVGDAVADPNKQMQEVTSPDFSDHPTTDAPTIISRRSTKRNRLASHADLISVLSMPKAGTKSIVSARSIRTNRSRLATATIGDIMDELASDETKYMRELRTLVDGVIPVLLSVVLSKADSAVAAGLFSRSSKVNQNDVTKPIVDMGISLERLKSLHRRVPKDNSDAFLSWVQSAQRHYSDYINVWRLGFEDVVINLASADEDPFQPAKVVHGPNDAAPWDEGLPRNAEGYVVNGDGERVDVAYMLKRPLVRLKYLAKSIRGINHIKPSEQAEKMMVAFQDLVDTARKRTNEERARLEDEAAANIDPTRARDPRSLAPLAGVRIDSDRCVRARDYFDMHLLHSSGQEVNCRVEMLFRDNAPGTGPGGDLLLCEVDSTGRWLFLPPIQQGHVSARNGDLQGEIIVMIRGFGGDRTEWSEVFSLRTDEEQAGFEWVQMLGLQPIPPQLSELKRDPSILRKPPPPASSHASSSLVSGVTDSTVPQKSRTPSPHEIEIPIGEQALVTSKKWGYETPEGRSKSRGASPVTPPSGDGPGPKELVRISPSSPLSNIRSHATADEGAHNSTPRPTSRGDEDRTQRTPRSLEDAVKMIGAGSPMSLRRTKAKRMSKTLSPSTGSAPRPSRQITLDDPEEDVKPLRKSSKRPRHKPQSSTGSSLSHSSKGFSVWMPTSDVEFSDESDDSDKSVEDVNDSLPRPQTHRRVSSVPSMDPPVIPKLRKTSTPTTPLKELVDEDSVDIPEPPVSAPSKLERSAYGPVDEEDAPPPVPIHRSPSPATPVTLKASKTPTFTPTLSGFRSRRRSSSPLKHEYEPSTATESSTESEEEASEEEEYLITSESSEDELDDDVPMPLMPIGETQQFPKVSPPASIYTLPNGTITPSQSASNTPYRDVPQTSSKASKSIASIFSWSDAGKWDSLHPDECNIVVTPGKIEIFEISVALLADGDEIIHPEGKAPLLALELTPLVPMRKSTAIDITIRSPPTSHSRLKAGNNIMLRSRNPADCAQLYDMLNQSRINNPTYIALQNARGPYGQSSWAEAMDRQNAARSTAGTSNGWFGGTLGRRSSYRKTSTRAASISAVTESSVGTMNSALRSALGKLSFGRNGRFNIRGSTLGSRSLNSFDTGSSGSGSGTTTPPIEPGRAPGAPAGITNTKCRLYERDTFSSKWRDMGSARLTIMLPDPGTPTMGMRQGKGSPGMRDPSQEKRIVVVGKTKSETLLDVTLGESSFERVARSGIAVSVWEDMTGPSGQAGTVGAVGGVSGARARVFMIQMKSERECAYSYSLLGKLRY